MIPAIVPIKARRNAPYAEEFPFSVAGLPYDLTSWTGRLQVRLYPGAAGDPLIDLVNVASDIEGVWIAEPSSGIVLVRIDKATLSALWTALGGPAEAGDPILLSYDLVLTSPDGDEVVFAEGTFTLEAGVTVV